MSSSDIPRLLTQDEIKSILSRVAKPQIMVSELREHTFDQIKKIYGYQLASIKLKPSKIEKMGDYIANKSERSFYQPGFAVGFNVAESVGQPATQLVLNTFHQAGQSGGEGFERFRRNIILKDYTKHRDAFRMKIHMEDKNWTFEDLYIKSKSFVTVSIDELLDTSRIIKEKYPFEDKTVYTPEFKNINNYTDLGCGIRLRFDKEKLFNHQIPLDVIALELEKFSGGDLFTMFVGPHVEGIIDIYPDPEKICTKENSDLEECCTIFENGILKNNLKSKDHRLGDYPNVISTSIEKIDVIKCISSVTDHYDIHPDKDDTVSNSHVRVWVNLVYMRKEGVPESKIEDLLNETGFTVTDSDEDGNYYVVESSTKDVISEIRKQIKAEDQKLQKKFSETGKLTSTPLYQAAYYNIIRTSGTDLAKVRNHPEVDAFHTISDSPTEIHAVHGIEVCRAYLEKEIYDLFDNNGQSIAPRNIRIMVDWMTSGSYPISVTPKNAYKSDNSIMRAFCFESPQINIVKGAVLSTEESISNVSARVLFGSQQTLGTGAFKVKEDPEIVELYDSFESKESTGAFRLTSQTLRGSIVDSKPNIPKAEGLFDENLSEQSSIMFF